MVFLVSLDMEEDSLFLGGFSRFSRLLDMEEDSWFFSVSLDMEEDSCFFRSVWMWRSLPHSRV